MTIWRFPLPCITNDIEVPKGGKVVLFGYPNAKGRDEFSVWLEVNETAPRETRRFAVFATGNEIPSGYSHRSSAIMPDGFHVFHLYEKED